ncbi:MAG TPA: ABC transporter permease [Rhizomicrobium sp.]|jgi:lipopolysaccharide transport system permease protein
MTIANDEALIDGPDVVIIQPRKGWLALDLPLLWRFRDLLMAFGWRDVRLRYRQTFLGVSWVILQPLLGAAIFAIVFGVIAKMPTQGVPYLVVSYSGLLGWTLFSTGLSRASTCLVVSAELIRKVYFPRLLMPLGIVPCLLLDFAIGGVFMIGLLIYYHIVPGWGLLLFPVCTLILLCMAMGLGVIAASLAVKYRDIQYIVPLFVQLMMYASPVGYSAAAVPSYIKPYYDLNPLVAPIEIMRWSLTGVGQFNLGSLIYSIVVTIIAMLLGLVVFRNTERKFADVI